MQGSPGMGLKKHRSLVWMYRMSRRARGAREMQGSPGVGWWARTGAGAGRQAVRAGGGAGSCAHSLTWSLLRIVSN
jgi:hypothetical protein